MILVAWILALSIRSSSAKKNHTALIVYHQPTAVEVERRGIEEMRDLIGHLCFAFVLVMGGIVIIMGGIRFMMWLFDRWFDRKLD